MRRPPHIPGIDAIIDAMPVSLLLSLAALAALVPAALLPFRHDGGRDAAFWMTLGVAFLGPVSWIYVAFAPGWRTGLSATLWINISVSLAVFAVLAATTRQTWRLAPLLLPYLGVLGVAATVWLGQPEHPLLGTAPPAWIQFHIVLAVATYALLTVAAVAGLGVFLQERALKTKRPNRLTRLLPSVADGEVLQSGLLTGSAVAVALGIASGMVTQYLEDQHLLAIAHKTMFAIATLVVLLVLLIAHKVTGVRGRRAARFVLLAYLLLTLAYPGVKFVQDVLLG
jgi:ABC-type uncharacterized transport system permease subunit